jgi:hypothetical protein
METVVFGVVAVVMALVAVWVWWSGLGMADAHDAEVAQLNGKILDLERQVAEMQTELARRPQIVVEKTTTYRW